MTRRRPKHTRGVFERPPRSGVWWIRYADQHGVIRREKVGSYATAVAAYAKRKTEVREGTFFLERRRIPTLAAFAKSYLERKKDRRTYKDLARYGKNWTEALGTKPLHHITAGDVERYAANRRETVSAQTVAHELGFLRSVMRAAIEEGLVEKSPVKRIPPPHNARVRYLTPDEETALIDALPEAAAPIVQFGIYTGLRRAEQFAIRWEHVDWRSEVLTVPRTKHGGRRHVELNETALAILRAMPRGLKGVYVFANKSGMRPLNAQNFYTRVFVPAVKAAKLSDLRWHDLRHTFASRLVMAGVDLNTVRELLGHKTMAMTLRYAHLSPGHRASAVRRLNGAQEKVQVDKQ